MKTIIYNKVASIAKGSLLLTFLLSYLLTFSSCGDSYLDNVPKGEKIPTTLKDFTDLIGDEYTNHTEDVTEAIYLLNDAYASDASLSYSMLYRANYNWDTSIDRVKENKSDEPTYYHAYSAISTANLIIENAQTATEATDEERRVAVAQARVLRDMRYFTVLNYYAKQYDPATAATDGGIPIIESAEVGAAYTQPSVQGVYDYLTADLEAALPDLPETSANQLYADKATGYAFAARLYLQMSNYDKALSYAQQALQYNDQLFDWISFYEQNKAIIDNSDYYQDIYSPMDFSFVENYNFCHGSNSYQGTEDRLTVDRGARFEAGDAAFLSRWKLRTVGSETYYSSNISGYFNRGGMTTTEVYLIEAECLARKGQISQAMDVVNKVRQARILPEQYSPLTATTTEEAVRIVRDVKANALILTFVPFCDARRLNLEPAYATTLTKTVDGEQRTLTPDSYLWVMPFPQGAIKNSGNGTITQNVDK